MLDTISKKRVLDREQLQANLYIAQGELEKAAKLTEEKLLSATTEIHGALMTLMEIALKEKRMEDAEYIADIDKQAEDMFLRLVEQMTEREGVTEQLKAENQME